MKKCELCNSSANLFCESDQATLCWSCDAKVHSANFLVTKHSRVLLCHSCQSLTPWHGSGPKFVPTMSLCNDCIKRRNDEDRDDDDEEEDDGGGGEGGDDEEEEEEDDDGDGDFDDDDEENQVVPWKSTPPPPISSSSNSSNYSSRQSNGDEGVSD